MSVENPQEPNETPVTSAAQVYSTPVTPMAGSAAETFLAHEVKEAQRSLMLTRIIGSLTALFVVCYLGYITKRFQDNMRPAAAAEIAHGLIAERVDENANALAADLKKRVPTLIEGLPDYAIKEMPQYREQLENQIIGDFTGYATENAPKLGEHLEDFLTAHKDEVKEMIEAGQDPAVTDRVGAQLEQEFMASLNETDAGGNETWREKIDKSLAALQEIKKKTARLAAGKNLSPSEQKTRRAVAILASKISMAEPDAATTAIQKSVSETSEAAAAAVSTTPGTSAP